jgi:hypothetical protein
MEFNVNIDASSTVLGAILVKLGEGNIDHHIYFSLQKLSLFKHNYTTIEREGLSMVYAL